MKEVVYWLTRNDDTRRAIAEKFSLSPYMSINRESYLTRPLSVEEYRLLKECQAMGYVIIRIKKP